MNILIVDDNKDMLDLIAEMVENLGYKYSIAKDGKEALELFKNETYDIIISDYYMPNMDGVALRLQIEQDYHECPPFIITSVDLFEIAPKYHTKFYAMVDKLRELQMLPQILLTLHKSS